MAQPVSYEVHDGVAHVTIERPDKRNAMTMEVFDALGEAAARAADDATAGAVLVALFGTRPLSTSVEALVARLEGDQSSE